MTCEFCGRDPYERTDSGTIVGVTCCDLGCAVYDSKSDDAEISVTSGELRDIAARISSLQWQVQRRDRAIEKLWKRRSAPAPGIIKTIREENEHDRADYIAQCQSD